MNDIDINKLEMELGDQCGCSADDKIYLPWAPMDVEEAFNRNQKEATISNDFRHIKEYVRRADIYKSVLEEWEKRRKNIEKKGKKT